MKKWIVSSSFPLMIPLIKWTSFIISILPFVFSLCSFHSTKSSMIIINLQFIQIFFSILFILLLFSYKFLFICVKWEILYFFRALLMLYISCDFFLCYLPLFWIGKKMNIFIVNRLTGDFKSSFKSASFSYTQYEHILCVTSKIDGQWSEEAFAIKFF